MNKTSDTPIENVMANSFKTLAIKKPIEKITIKEITDLTGVIRPTFYNHFQDKYELLEWIIKTDVVNPAMEKFMKGDFKSGVVGFLENFRREKEFYRACALYSGQNSFEDILGKEIRDIIFFFVDSGAIKDKLWYKWLTPVMVVDFFSTPVADSIIKWINNGMTLPPEEIWECFVYLFTHSIVDMIAGVK